MSKASSGKSTSNKASRYTYKEGKGGLPAHNKTGAGMKTMGNMPANGPRVDSTPNRPGPAAEKYTGKGNK